MRVYFCPENRKRAKRRTVPPAVGTCCPDEKRKIMTTRLSPAQLLCLQCLGYRAPEIFDIDGRQFEQIFQSVPGAGVAWEKAAAVL